MVKITPIVTEKWETIKKNSRSEQSFRTAIFECMVILNLTLHRKFSMQYQGLVKYHV